MVKTLRIICIRSPLGGVGIELSNSRGLSYIKITTNEPTISITSNGTYDVYEYSKAEVNVPSSGGGGGGGGFVTGTLTVETTVQTSVDVKITDTTAIGFTPTKFLLFKDTDTKTNATIYSNTYTEQAGVETRTRSIYDGQGGCVVVSGSATSWTTPSSGFLRLLEGEIYINASSSYSWKLGHIRGMPYSNCSTRGGGHRLSVCTLQYLGGAAC